MRLLDVNNFILVKKKVPMVVEHLLQIDIGTINRNLRTHFIGHGVDSISAKYKDKLNHVLMVQLTKDNVIMSFVFTFVPLTERTIRAVENVLKPVISNVLTFCESLRRELS